MYFVYVLHSELKNRFYIGSTKNISLRLIRHNAGKVISTKSHRPWSLVYSESFQTLSEARKRELQIKSWKNRNYMINSLKLNI